MLEEIFGLEEGEMDRNLAPQILIKNLPNAFVMVKSYPRPVEESLIGYITEFLKEAIDTMRDDVLFFVIIDNVSLMDASSWNLFKAISNSLDHFILVLCI